MCAKTAKLKVVITESVSYNELIKENFFGAGCNSLPAV